MIESESPEVFLYGAAERVGIVAQFCRAAGIRVKAIVYGNGETPNRFGLPGLDVNELNERTDFARIPIVICGNPGITLEDEFITSIVSLKNNFEVPNPVLHPSFLSEFAVLRKRRKLLLNGFPGSGNMVFQSLVNELISNGPVESPDDIEKQLIQFNSEYFCSMRNLLDRCMDIHDRKFTDVVPVLRDQIMFMMEMAGPQFQHLDFTMHRLLMFFGLQARSSSWTDTMASHEAIDNRTLQFYRNRGFTILNIIRHPLDVLVSCAGKISFFTINSETFQGNRRHARTMIDNLDWFQSMVEAIDHYLELAYLNRSALNVYRYEDLVDYPVETIRRIAETIGVEVDRAKAEELWASLGFKPLKNAPKNHFWRPGREKWREFLTEKHLAIVRASNLPELMHEFGYSSDFSVDPSLLRSIKDPAIPDLSLVSVKDFAWHTLTGKRWVLRDPDVHMAEDPELGVCVITNHEPLLETAGRLLRSSILHHVVRAARWPYNLN